MNTPTISKVESLQVNESVANIKLREQMTVINNENS
jgi:hypothetical protein